MSSRISRFVRVERGEEGWILVVDVCAVIDQLVCMALGVFQWGDSVRDLCLEDLSRVVSRESSYAFAPSVVKGSGSGSRDGSLGSPLYRSSAGFACRC
jgi:hypothetical protein